MPEFVWKAAQADTKVLEGRLHAASQALAMQQLRAQGLTPLQLAEAGSGGAASLALAPGATSERFSWSGGKGKAGDISASDVLAMTSELSIMLKAGLSLDNALRVLMGMSAKPGMVKLTQTILDDVCLLYTSRGV